MELNVELNAKQSLAVKSAATEILYGGAAGGGKSYFMRVFAIMLCALIPGLNVYLFRRTYDDLIKNHMEGTGGFPVLLAPWVQSGHVKIVNEEIRFWNGSRIFLCHCQLEKHRFKYQGAEIHVLLIDELTMFTDTIYRFLRGRMRAPNLVIPDWATEFFKEKFGVDLPSKIPLALSGSNPGNIGHSWVKWTFIDNALPMQVRQMPKSEGGMLRQFIPATLDDNAENVDVKDYEGKLEGLGNKELVRAMRYGDWSIIAGAFFDNIREDKHKIGGFTPPKHWTKYRSIDWGSAKPFSVGWWCIAEDEWVKLRDGTERMFPKGALIRYREWYGVKRNEDGSSMANVGVRMSVEEVARGILQREAGETIDEQLSKADPSMWQQNGGPSFIERMMYCDKSDPHKAIGPRFGPADNSRVQGWQQMYARLDWDGVDDGEPMLYVTEDCHDWWRTVPVIMHDENKREDVMSSMEDHAADECFIAGTLIHTSKGMRTIESMSIGDLVMTRKGYRAVVAAFSVGERDVYELRKSDGGALIGTGGHPVWVPNKGFTELAKLCVDDVLQGHLTFTHVVDVPKLIGKRKVYNLTVTEEEEYYANDVLVHNCRYACMARPVSRVKKPKAASGPTPWSLDWIIANDEGTK